MLTQYSLAFAAVAVTSLAYWLWQRRHIYRTSWLCQGPLALPLIGNAASLLTYRNGM